MNPLRVSARNYRTFDELDLELPPGCLAILGDNGAGKSSILNVIDLALFGARDLGRYLTRGSAETEMELGLEFEHRNELYRVRRSYSARGRGQAKLDLEQAAEIDVGEIAWRPLTRETAKETQAALEQLLGLTRQTFRASAFLAQGDGAAWTEAEPRDRKAILAEVLGLDLWARMLVLARADRTVAEGELQKLAGRMEAAEAELAGRDAIEAERAGHVDRRAELAAGLKEAQRTLADLDAYLARAREASAALGSAKQLVAAKAQALEQAQRRCSDLVDEDTEIQEALLDMEGLVTLAERVPELEARLAEIAAAAGLYAEDALARAQVERTVVEATANRDEAVRAAARMLELTQDLTVQADAKAAEELPICQTCGQAVHGEAKTRAIAELRRQSAEAYEEAQGHQEMAATAHRLIAEGEALLAQPSPPQPEPTDIVKGELALARQAQPQAAALNERAKRLPAIRQETTTLEAERATLQEQKTNAQAEVDRLQAELTGDPIDVVEKRALALQAKATAALTAIADTDRAVARCDAQLDRLTSLSDTLTADRLRRDTLAEERQVMLELEKAYGQGGIPALIIENAAIPQIETEANRILGELGTSFRVELRTQRALKSGDGVREALDIVVYAPDGEALYEDFSGGERTRLNLSLRIALARLLAHRRGAEVRLLALDEPEFLDQAGMDALARVLAGLTSDFDTIIVISHVPALREAFDQVLEVVKDGERSRITNGIPVEAIA